MVILLLAIVQALIAGISVNVEPADEAKLLKSLAESFKQAREENPRHLKIWAMTQSDVSYVSHIWVSEGRKDMAYNIMFGPKHKSMKANKVCY